MEIKKALEYGDNIREKITELYVEELYDIGLKFFSNNKEKLKKVFLNMIAPEYFYVVIIDNELAGMAACLDKGHLCINANFKSFVIHLGLFKGLIANLEFKDYSEKYGKYIDDKTARIENVATNSKYKRKGIASAIIKHIFSLSEYKHYFLEVADTNMNALKLYEKLGFKEVYRKKVMPGSGINYLIYMKYSKE